jgi:hypothetical protein
VDGVLYNASLLGWHSPSRDLADVLFTDYENVETVVAEDIFSSFRSVFIWRTAQFKRTIYKLLFYREVPCDRRMPGMVDLHVDTSGAPDATMANPGAHCLWAAAGLEGATDLALLSDGRVAAALPDRDTVLLYSAVGELEVPLQPGDRAFCGPSSVAALADGRLAVLDSIGVLLFRGDGGFLRAFPLRGLGATGGLCQDGDGGLAIINRFPRPTLPPLVPGARRTGRRW